MQKSADAFRTISEVAEWLDVPTHVLRFWESKFSQIKPLKRAGGRRYYRPKDMLLIGGIKQLLHEDGLTIKGAQKLLKDQGVKHVMSLSQPLDPSVDISDEADLTPDPTPETVEPPQQEPAIEAPVVPQPEPEMPSAEVIPLKPVTEVTQPSLFDDDDQLNFWADENEHTENAAQTSKTPTRPAPEATFESLSAHIAQASVTPTQMARLSPIMDQMRAFLEKNG